MNKLVLAHLAALSANIIYGINYTIAKEVMPKYIGALGFASLRIIGAGLLFWLSALAMRRERLPLRDYGPLFIASLMGVTSNGLSFLIGLNLTTPINASIILTSNPIFVVIIAALVFGTRISARMVLGICMGLLGASLVILQRGSLSFSSDTTLGDLLILFNAVSYAAYIVYVRKLMLRYHALTVVRWMFTFGWFTILPIGWPQLQAVDWVHLPSGIVWGIAFVVLFTTFYNYMAINFSIKHAGPAATSAYTNVQPVVATIVAVWVGTDRLDSIKLAAAVLVLGGVYLVGQASRRAELQKAQA